MRWRRSSARGRAGPNPSGTRRPHELTIDHATFTITFQRTLPVPREDVFDAWTEPEQLAAWWDPTGAPLAVCEIDPRPGGAFRFVNGAAHGPPFAGTYR